jgi:hypothetical protein
LGAATTAQAPLGLLVASRSPPLRVAMEVIVRDERLRDARGPAAALLVHASINLALIA